MVESGGLENHCGSNSTEGSNPSLSAMIDLNFNCAVILNGTITNEDIAFIKRCNNIIIAADGAANILIYNDIIPNYIVGDLDSFNSDIPKQSQIINIHNQSLYDFEKCLNVAISNNLNRVLVFGINGGRYDHTLNNWSIFIKYTFDLDLFCYTSGEIGTLITKDISFNTELNGIISIIPTPTATLTANGLKWNLNNTILEFGKSEGARNIAISNKITIKLHSGKYMLFRNY